MFYKVKVYIEFEDDMPIDVCDKIRASIRVHLVSLIERFTNITLHFVTNIDKKILNLKLK